MARPVTRRATLALLGTALAGCTGTGGSTTTMTDNPLGGDASQLGDLDLTSPAFDDGEPIHREYGRKEQDLTSTPH